MDLIFVYGTLKRGHQNHSYLADEEFIGEGNICGFQLVCLGEYPVIIEDDGQMTKVEGELYSVSPSTMTRLDILEGDEYDKIDVDVNIGETTINASTYIASGTLLEALQRGRQHRFFNSPSWPG